MKPSLARHRFRRVEQDLQDQLFEATDIQLDTVINDVLQAYADALVAYRDNLRETES